MKTNKIIFFAFSLAILIGIAGCAPNDTGLNNTDRLTTQTRINNNRNWNNRWDTDFDDFENDISNNRNINLNNGIIRGNGNGNGIGNNDNGISAELAKKISALPEVKSSSVVLTDDTCLVGVNLNGNNINISSALRQKIENIVTDTTNIRTEDVRITADPDLLTRIQGISQQMTTNVGNDIRDFTDDIEDIIRAIVPGTQNRRNINR